MCRNWGFAGVCDHYDVYVCVHVSVLSLTTVVYGATAVCAVGIHGKHLSILAFWNDLCAGTTHCKQNVSPKTH